jgi:hypothetical protein
MKKQYVILCFSLVFNALLGQNQNQDNVKEPYFFLRREVVVQEINFLTLAINEERLVLFNDVVFKKMQEIKDNGETYIVVKAVDYVKKRKQIAPKDRPFKTVEIGKYYVVKTDLLKDNVNTFTPRTWEVRAGVVNIPVKFYLPNDGDPLDFSSKSVSLGTTIGVAQQVSRTRRNLWVNYLLGAQFTMVTPTSDDFLNFNAATDNSNTLSAFSLSLGIALDFEGIEVGFFLGKDYLPGSAAQNWKHNGDTWFSIGIGTNLSNGKQKLTNY